MRRHADWRGGMNVVRWKYVEPTHHSCGYGVVSSVGLAGVVCSTEDYATVDRFELYVECEEVEERLI